MFKKVYPIIITLIFVCLLAVMLLSFTGVLPNIWTIITHRRDSVPYDGEIPPFLSEMTEDEREQWEFSMSQNQLENVLTDVEKPEYLRWNFTVSRFWNEQSSNTTYNVYSAGDLFRVMSVVEGYDYWESVTSNGQSLIFQNSDGGLNEIALSSKPSYREYCAITETSRFETLTQEEIDTVKLEKLKLNDGREYDTVFVKSYNANQKRMEYYWFSLQYGIIMCAEYYDEDETLLYRMETVNVSTAEFDTAIFGTDFNGGN